MKSHLRHGFLAFVPSVDPYTYYIYPLPLLAVALSRAFDLVVAATAVGKCATAVPVLRVPSPSLVADHALPVTRRQGTPGPLFRFELRILQSCISLPLLLLLL